MSADHPELRIGHAERNAAATLLRQSAELGRLTAAELDERLAAAAAARTQSDLDVVVADLRPLAETPAPLAVSAPAVPGRPGYRIDDPLVLTAGMSSTKRQGAWEVPPFVRAHAVLDNVRLDCLLAHTQAPIIDLELLPGGGSVLLVLPEGWAVNAERLGKGIGTVSVKVPAQPAWGCPLIVVRGSVGLGGFKARGANWFDRRRNRLDR